MNADRPTLEAKFRELDAQHENVKSERVKVYELWCDAYAKYNEAWNNHTNLKSLECRLSAEKSALMKQINEIK